MGPASEPLPPALQRQLAPGYVVVHTPSMWPYKQWPLPHFRRLIELLAQGGRQVVLTGEPGPTTAPPWRPWPAPPRPSGCSMRAS